MSFRALEAAICPLPLSREASAHLAAAAGPDAGGITPPPAAFPLLDPSASASALILRDLHHGLIRVADGWNPKHMRAAPDAAQLLPEDPRAQIWQERLWMCLLAPAHAETVAAEAKVAYPTPCSCISLYLFLSTAAKFKMDNDIKDKIVPPLQEAAAILQMRDYVELTARQRVAILSSLVDVALSTDLLRYHIASKLESLSNPALRLAAGPTGTGDMPLPAHGAPMQARPRPQFKKPGRRKADSSDEERLANATPSSSSEGSEADEQQEAPAPRPNAAQKKASKAGRLAKGGSGA